MYMILWEYIVKAGREFDFEKIYGLHGDWEELFKQGDGYLGTDLFHDSEIPRRYLTMDRWVSSTAYDGFLVKYDAAYEALDKHCQSLTEREKMIARGNLVSLT